MFLYFTQAARGTTHHGSVIAVGLLLAMIVTVLLAAWESRRRSGTVVLAASAAAAVAFISAWFRALTRTHEASGQGPVLVIFLATAVLIVVLCTILIRAESAPALAPGRRRWLSAGLALTGLVLVPALAYELFAAEPVEVAQHLRIAWTSLDVYEFLAMAATGFTLHRRLAVAVVPATITGSLLLCDAWINVTATTGAGLAEGIGLAFIEVPFAALSFWVAARVAPQFRSALHLAN